MERTGGMIVEIDRFAKRRQLLQASGKAALRKEISEGGQSTIPRDRKIEWPWSAKGHATEFGFTGTVVPWDVPMDGLYLIGAHGASGADVRHMFKKKVVNKGGSAAMIAVMVKLNKGQKLGIIVGGSGRAVYTGTTRDGDRMTSGGGGGASLVMVWHKSEVRAPIIIAAGGGGATCMYNGVNASLDTKGLDAPSTAFAIGGSGGLGMKTSLAGHNAVDGGSGRGGEAYFAGGGSGFYGAGGLDEYFQQSGPTPALAVTERRLPAPPPLKSNGRRQKIEGRRHLGGYGGGGAPCAVTMGGGGGGGFGGGGGGMHGGGGGGCFVSQAGGVATLLKEIGWRGDGFVRIERLAGPDLSKLVPSARFRLDNLIAGSIEGKFRVVKSGSMEVIY